MGPPTAPQALVVAVLVLASLQPQRVEAVKALTDWYSGILTHYGGKQDKMDPNDPSFGSKEGACGYGEIPKDRWPYFSVGALATNNSFFLADPVNGCGQCFQIQCVSGMTDYHKGICYKDSRGVPKSILLVITDKCPECGEDHLDVQSLAFAKLTNPDYGRININYRRIECTPPEDMKVSVMDFVGANRWLRIAIDDTGGRGSVTQVYVKSSGAKDWIPMQNKWGAAWELSSAPSPPLDFKMETDDGEEVVAREVIKTNGGISQGAFAPRVKYGTGVQFTITDPAAALVQAAQGPADNFDPMVATSDTPGNDKSLDPRNSSASPPAASIPRAIPTPLPSASATPPCVDVPAPGDLSCAQLKERGKCQANDLIDKGYCALTCGRCQPPTSGAIPKPAASASSGGVTWGVPPGAPAQPLPADKTTTAPSPAQKPAAPTSGLAPSTEPSAAAPPAGPCLDVKPPGNYTCEEQKRFGKCGAPYLQQYCALTCGRCKPEPTATAATGAPAPELGPVKADSKGSTGQAPSTENAKPRAPVPKPASIAAISPAPESLACVDVRPPGTYSCQEQKVYGKCGSAWMQPFCAATCGRCPPKEQAVQSFSQGPSQPGGRKLLGQLQA